MSGYVVRGLDPAPFAPLYGLDDAALAERNVLRYRADEKPGFPCRVTLEDAELGEELLLLNYEHLPVDSPYRSRHAIFVRDGAMRTACYADRVPAVLAARLLSVRAFDGDGMMTDAAVTPGEALEPLIERMLGDPAVDYLHIHSAGRGCYLTRIDRG